MPDPDPAFFSSCRSRVLKTKNLKIVTAGQKILYLIFLSNIAVYLSLGLHKRIPSYRRSLRPSKESIQHLKA